MDIAVIKDLVIGSAADYFSGPIAPDNPAAGAIFGQRLLLGIVLVALPFVALSN